MLSALKSKHLIYQLIQRDIASKNKGSILGNGWSILTSIATLAMYTFIFTKVFSAKWPHSNDENHFFYALQIYTGLIVYNFVSEILSRAPTLVTDQSNLIQKVAFSSEILPLIPLGSAFYFYIINSLIINIACVFLLEKWHPSSLLVPLTILPVASIALGLSYIISSLAVFIKDIRQVTYLSLPLLMFLSPIFYSSTTLSGWFKTLLELNPLSTSIEASRALYFHNQPLEVKVIFIQTFFGIILIAIGFNFFSRLKKGFSDAF